MHLAYVMTQEPGATDRLLSDFAEAMQGRGLRLAGIDKSHVNT